MAVNQSSFRTSATSVGLAVAILSGCVGGPRYGDPGPAYPVDVSQADVLDIQVQQRIRDIRFTNTTAQSFEDARIWLNGWFSAEVGTIGVGEAVILKLRMFTDVHGLQPKVGGFFASTDPEPLVLVQLESDGVFYGLVLIEPDAR